MAAVMMRLWELRRSTARTPRRVGAVAALLRRGGEGDVGERGRGGSGEGAELAGADVGRDLAVAAHSRRRLPGQQGGRRLIPRGEGEVVDAHRLHADRLREQADPE